jgi:uncharacterized membrane protein
MVIEELLGEICHQLPARCLTVAGVVMPACARCSGIYLGVLLAAAFYAVPGKRRLFLYHPSYGGAALAVLAVGPCTVDFFGGWLGYPLFNGNGSRFVASLFAGWGAWVLLAGAAALLRWGAQPERRLGPGQLVGSLLVLLLPGLLLAMPYPAAATVFAGATLAGAASFFALLNYFPFALFLQKKRYRPALGAAILCGVVALAVVEIKWGRAVYDAVAGLIRR